MNKYELFAQQKCVAYVSAGFPILKSLMNSEVKYACLMNHVVQVKATLYAFNLQSLWAFIYFKGDWYWYK